MSAQRAGAVTTAQLGALLSPAAQTHGIGVVRWSSVKPRCHQGVLDVVTSVEGVADGKLRIYLLEPAASEPTLQYLVNNVAIRRLDVNGNHKQLVHTTHKHRYEPASGREDAYEPSDIPEVPLGPSVSPGTYRRLFEAFAKECHVALPDGYWVEPPREVTL